MEASPLNPHIEKPFVYTTMSLKSELCITAASAHNLAVVEAVSEGDVGLKVDDDAEVKQDEAHHQMLVDCQAGTAQGTEMVFSYFFSILFFMI